MIGDEPRGMRRRDILKIRRREIEQLATDDAGGRRWLTGAAGVLLVFLAVVLVYTLYRSL